MLVPAIVEPGKPVRLLPYPDGFRNRNEHFTQIENLKLEGEIQFTGTIRGRSAVHFTWVHTATGMTGTMFLTDLIDVMRLCTIDHGRVSGTWEPCKRGTNYGIRLVK